MEDLKSFLEAAKLSHLLDYLSEQGMELKFLLLANDNDLKELVPRMVDKIKLRNAIETYRKAEIESIDVSTVSNFEIIGTDIECPPSPASNVTNVEVSSLNVVSVTPEPGQSDSKTTSTPQIARGPKILPDFVEEEWQFIQEIGPLEDRKPLKQLLELTTFGKALLEKEEPFLTPKERKALVQLVVEHQLRTLPSIKDTIRQEVWSSWAKEICSVFKKEHPDIYYVPYRVTERQALPASGLLHNRLITHRRFLKSDCKRANSSGNSSPSSGKSAEKRLRPLPPDSYHSYDDPTDASNDIEWLEGSSSPFDVVLRKWQSTFKVREKLLKEKSIEDYFQQFPVLRLPAGHQLLESDFDKNYPLGSATFIEHFPLIKKRLLELLVNKGSHIRAESAVSELLDLATEGEEQGSVAALRCIPYLVKQVPPVSRKVKGKQWKPARIEVSQAFIGHVCSPGDIQRCIDDRLTLARDRGITFGPYIIAVGTSWSTIYQYEVVVTKNVRYQFSDVTTALTTAFKIYFALDIEYAGDAALCWVFLQRAVYKIVTKFDALYDKSVTIRELIKDCERF